MNRAHRKRRRKLGGGKKKGRNRNGKKVIRICLPPHSLSLSPVLPSIFHHHHKSSTTTMAAKHKTKWGRQMCDNLECVCECGEWANCTALFVLSIGLAALSFLAWLGLRKQWTNCGVLSVQEKELLLVVVLYGSLGTSHFFELLKLTKLFLFAFQSLQSAAADADAVRALIPFSPFLSPQKSLVVVILVTTSFSSFLYLYSFNF